MGFNFKEASENMGDGDFSPITEGRYTLKVETATIGKAKTGTTMLNTQLVITDGDFKNRKVWKSFSLDKPKAMRFVVDFLKALGSDIWQQDDVSNDALVADVLGKHVSAWLVPGTTNNGNPTTEASKFKDAAATAATTGGSDLFS